MCQPELVAESGRFRSVRLKKKVGHQALCMPAVCHMYALIASYISIICFAFSVVLQNPQQSLETMYLTARFPCECM